MTGPAENAGGALQSSDVVIRPPGRWVAPDLRELWSYRELFAFLVWRDLTVRYKQTLLGATWVVLQPVLTTAVFALFFGRLIGVPSDGVPYPLFVFTGLAPWLYFAKTVTQGTMSVVGSANLITKIYFPRLLIPAAVVAAGLIDLAMALAVVLALTAAYGEALHLSLMALPLLMLLTGVFALGVAVALAALNVTYRDVGAVVPLLLQLWMLATPIIYPASLVPERWRVWLDLNPLTGLVNAYRAALFGSPFDTRSLAITVVAACGLVVVAAIAFRRMEASFADIV